MPASDHRHWLSVFAVGYTVRYLANIEGLQCCRAKGSERAMLLGLFCMPARSEQFPKPCAKYVVELSKILRNH